MGMRKAPLILGFVLAAAGISQAADPPPQLSLTVYNSNLALVQDVRRMDVPAGRTRIEFKDVSAAIRPETVTLTGSGIGIVEQNFDYDLLTPAKMMEKMVGKQIKIVRTIPGTGKEISETATVLSVNDGVILKIGDRIEALRDDGIPTRVVFSSIPENLRASPTLSVTVDTASAGARDLILQYLTTGLSWNADYVVAFDEDKSLLNIQGWVTVRNTSGTSFKNAKIEVVAGNVSLSGSDQLQPWQRQQFNVDANRSAGTESANAETIADYLIYPLAEDVTVADNQTKQVGFINMQNVKAGKTYEYSASRFASEANPQHVSSVLRFANSENALPAGTVRVYMRDQAGENKFVGENTLGHTPASSDIMIKLGEAFDVTAQPTLLSTEKESDTRYRYSMSYSFKNARSKPVTVEFRQSGLWGNSTIDKESIPSTRIDAGTVEWSVPVSAHGETVLTYTLDSGS
jgi:hypothetical protein